MVGFVQIDVITDNASILEPLAKKRRKLAKNRLKYYGGLFSNFLLCPNRFSLDSNAYETVGEVSFSVKFGLRKFTTCQKHLKVSAQHLLSMGIAFVAFAKACLQVGPLFIIKCVPTIWTKLPLSAWIKSWDCCLGEENTIYLSLRLILLSPFFVGYCDTAVCINLIENMRLQKKWKT